VARPWPGAQEPVAQESDLLQSSGDHDLARLDFGTANEKIASRRSLYVMIMAAIVIVVGMVGVGASIGYRNGISPPADCDDLGK
jgi:hypothetical protein